MINEYDKEDETTASVAKEVIDNVNNTLGEVIATLDNKLYIMNPNNSEERIVRKLNTNSSDLIADSFYWYFNEKLGLNCDVAMTNSGGIRADIQEGDFSYISSKTIQPFGNVLCLTKVSGHDLKIMLEIGASHSPDENGSLLKCAGLTYVIDTSIPSTIVLDENEDFVSEPTGEYRVKDIMIYNKDTQSYEPLDEDKIYNLGSTNYILRNGGCGMNFIMNNEAIVDYVAEDYLATADYIKAFNKADDGLVHINNASAPIANLNNYIYDYENPFGSNRLVIK